MIRLIFPLVVITAAVWVTGFLIPKAVRNRSLGAAKGFFVSFAIAVLALGLVYAIFYYGGR